MTTQEYLAQVRRTDAQIAAKEARIEELRAYARRIGSMHFENTKVRSSKCASNLCLDSILDKIDATVKQEEEALAVLGKQIGQVSAVIAELTDYDESLCLSLRYIKLLPWRAVADAMGLSQRQVARIHLRALEHIKIPTE
ncbi:MAG: hypothetical protein IJ766_01410 [Clostridia bacterium]|nr:hypothetical protein [Clostridia bacterium]